MLSDSNTPWDDLMREMIKASPQAFISLVAPNASFIGVQPTKQTVWKLESDSYLMVKMNSKPYLLNIEFQSTNDPTMAERLLRYNVIARAEYGMPVHSCVIYLFKD